MSDWSTLLSKPLAITSIYGCAPCLDDVNIAEICLSDDGPGIKICVGIKELPRTPPKRWTSHPFNRVAFWIQLFPVESISISSLVSNQYGGIAFSRRDEKIHTSIVNETGTFFECISRSVSVDDFKPYVVNDD